MTTRRSFCCGAFARIAAVTGLAAGLLCSVAAHAGPLLLETAQTVEQLSGGLAPWRSTEWSAQWRDSSAWSLSGTLRRTERFSLVDQQFEAGATIVLAPRWRVEAEAALSGTHQVLPERRWRGRVWRDGVAGWNFAIGLGRTNYRNAAGAQGHAVAELQAERYIHNARLAWTGSATRLDGGGAGSAQLWRANWYARDNLALGGLFGFGREAEILAGSGLVSSPVRSVAADVQWSLTPRWSLSAELSRHSHVGRYERSGLRLGLRVQL